jgi:hypothetical protein
MINLIYKSIYEGHPKFIFFKEYEINFNKRNFNTLKLEIEYKGFRLVASIGLTPKLRDPLPVNILFSNPAYYIKEIINKRFDVKVKYLTRKDDPRPVFGGPFHPKPSFWRVRDKIIKCIFDFEKYETYAVFNLCGLVPDDDFNKFVYINKDKDLFLKYLKISAGEFSKDKEIDLEQIIIKNQKESTAIKLNEFLKMNSNELQDIFK